MGKLRRSYSKQEKLEIVKLSLEKGQTLESLAKRFDISIGSIYNWRSKYYEHKENAFPGKGNKQLTDTERKIERLEKELKESKLETSKRDRKSTGL